MTIHDKRLFVGGHGGSSGGGGKGGSSTSGQQAPNTLFSTATVKLVDLIGEGEIQGVVGGDKGIYLNGTPLQNADGTYNFKGVTTAYRVGLPDQSSLPGFPDVSDPITYNEEIKNAVPSTKNVTEPTRDSVNVTLMVPALYEVYEKDGRYLQATVSYRIEVRYNGGPWVVAVNNGNVTGKCTSPYYRDHIIPLPRAATGNSYPWQIRVTKLTPDSLKDDKQTSLYLQSITSITNTKFTYPNSALVGIAANAKLFNQSMPARGYLVDGVKMDVPSNYNPVTRAYTGVWNGTFKTAWTNNPAWALYMLLVNNRFGLGQYIDASVVDKWALYEIAQYCDQMVPDGKGGTEPRFTFNGVLKDQKEAYAVLQTVAQAFRGMTYWSAGAVTATQNRRRDPVCVVTPSNVIGGKISYSSSAKKARHTVCMVTWNDPDNLYKQAIEIVQDDDGIARYGYNPTKVDAFGCTSRGQAQRYGLWTLATELKELQIAVYRAGMDHAFIRPGDVVAIQDPNIADIDVGGRLALPTRRDVLKLDHPITLLAGKAWTVSVTMPNGTLSEVPVSASSVGVLTDTLNLDTLLTNTPLKDAMWLCSTPTVVPQQFTVIGFKEVEPHIFEINALQYEPAKFDAVDQGRNFETLPTSNFPNIVKAPINLAAQQGLYTDNGLPKQSILLSWSPGQPFNSIAYYVTALKPDGTLITLPKTNSTSVDFLDTITGTWTFMVVAVGINNQVSDTTTLVYEATGWEGTAGATIENLQVKGGGTVFYGKSCTMSWTVKPPAKVPASKKYRCQVRILDSSTLLPVHNEVLAEGVTEYTYGYDLNVNEGGPRRSFIVSVAAISVTGDVGTSVNVAVSNPAPAKVTPTVTATSENIYIGYPLPTETDIAGAYIWISTTNNFNPQTVTPVYAGSDIFNVFSAVPETQYYVRVALYDSFGKVIADLNISDQVAIKPSNTLFDPTAPTAPGKPVLTTAVEISQDGTITSSVTATWAASSPASNVGSYLVAVSVNNVIDFQTFGTDVTKWVGRGFAPGANVTAKILAVSKNGFAKSIYSATTTIQAALNTTAPASATNFTVTSSFQRAFLSWTAPTNKDLKWTEVWGFVGNSVASTPPAAAVLIDTVPYGVTTFNDDIAAVGGIKTYWLRPVNTSDVKAVAYTGPQKATSSLIIGEQLTDKAITGAKFGTDIDWINLVDTVPTAAPGANDPTTVTLRSTRKLYRWNPAPTSKWLPVVQAEGATGLLGTDQLELDAVTKNLDKQNLETLKTVTALPSATGYTGPSTLIYQGKLYRIKTINGTTDWYSTTDIATIDGDIPAQRVAGTLTTDVISKITGLTDTQIKNLDGAKLLDNTVVGKSIVGYTITGTKLNIGSVAANLLPIGDFIEGLDGWSATEGVGGFSVNRGEDGINGSNAARIDRGTDLNTTYSFQQSDFSSVDPSQVYGISAWARGNPSAAGFTIRLIWYKADKTLSSVRSADDIISNQSFGTTARQYTAQVTSPSDAAFCRTRVIHASTSTVRVLYVGILQIRRAVGGTLIEDGAVTTEKVLANSIIGKHVAAGTMTASKLTLIDTTNLVANGEFLDGLDNWVPSDPTSVVGVTAGIPSGATAVAACRLTRNGTVVRISYGVNTYTDDVKMANGFPCTAGEEFYVEVWLRSNVATSGTVLDLPFRATSDGSTGVCTPSKRKVNDVVSTVVPANTWVKVSAVFTATVSGKIYPRVNVITDPSVLYVTSFRTQRRNGASLVVDGSINADHVDATSIASVTVTADNIFAKMVNTQRVVTSMLAAQSITGSKLLVASNNRAYNADVSQKLLGFQQINGSIGALMTPLGSSIIWSPDSMTAFMMNAAGTPTAGQTAQVRCYNIVAVNGTNTPYQVTAGQYYEFSAAASVFRCTAEAYIQWLDASGSSTGTSPLLLTITNAGQGAQGGGVATFPRIGSMGLAPAGTTQCYLVIQMRSTGLANPAVYGTALMFGSIPKTQFDIGTAAGVPTTGPREFSQYVDPGSTFINGGNITTKTIDAESIKLDTLTADTGFISNLTAATVTATAISAAIVNTGIISADMLAVGLNTGNLLFNTDFLGGLNNWATSQSGGNVWSTLDGGPTGLYVAAVTNSGGAVPPANAVAELRYYRTMADGTKSLFLPVTQGKRYEFHTHWKNIGGISLGLIIQGYDASGATVGSATSFTSPDNNLARSLFAGNLGRLGGFWTAPTGASQVSIRIRAVFDGVASVSSFYITGVYAGNATEKQSKITDWSAMANTIIDGGTLATGTVDAKKIVAFSITADQLNTKIITTEHIAVTGLEASVIRNLKVEQITIGTTTTPLSSIFTSGKTTINGGVLETGSVKAQSYVASQRGLSVRGCEFYAERTDNADAPTLTGYTAWTAGRIFYTDNDGVTRDQFINAGRSINTSQFIYWRFAVGADGLMVGEDVLRATDDPTFVVGTSTKIMMCVVSGTTGIMPLYGGTIIDGTKISTYSIAAVNLATDSVQARQLKAGTVTTTHISSDGIDAKVINGGTIIGNDFYVGSSAFRLSASRSRLSVFDGGGVERVMLGALNTAQTSFGLILKDAAGNEIINSGGVIASRLTGSIAGTQLADGAVSSGKLADGAVGDIKMGSGPGTNWLFNSDRMLGNVFSYMGTAANAANGAAVNAGAISLGMNLNAAYTLLGGATSYIRAAGTLPANCYLDVATTNMDGNGNILRFPVEAGKWYEGSAYMQGLRCNFAMVISWINAAGTYLGPVSIKAVPAYDANSANLNAWTNPLTGGANLTQYRRVGLLSQAPPGAVSAEIAFRMVGTGVANSYVFWTRSYFGEARVNQTELSAWTPASNQVPITQGSVGTFFNPDSIPSTYIANIQSNKIVSTNLSAINADLGTVTAGVLQSTDGKFKIELGNRRILIYD